MDFKAYQLRAMRTKDRSLSVRDELLLGAIGSAGEIGEVSEIIKKHVYHGKPFSKAVLAKEIGDVLWYLALLCDAASISFNAVALTNLQKLENRYPEGFTREAANARRDE